MTKPWLLPPTSCHSSPTSMAPSSSISLASFASFPSKAPPLSRRLHPPPPFLASSPCAALRRNTFGCSPLRRTTQARTDLSVSFDHSEKNDLSASPGVTVLETVAFLNDKQEERPLSQKELLWRAIKLPIYSVALVPLSVGSAAAYWQTGDFLTSRFGILLASAVLIIAWLNLSNDAYDAETGVDKGKPESVVNMTGSREGVLISAYVCLIFGLAGLLWASWQAQNMQIFSLLAGAICCGYIYQCPPFRLSYLGIGEPLCFLAFGPLATTAFYLSQSTGSLQVSSMILGAATLVGITTTLILFCSHFHQIEGDRLVGKLSPLVRLGTVKGMQVVKMAVFGLYSILLALAAAKILPYPCALCSLLTLPIGMLVVDFVAKYHDDKEKIFLAKYFCVRLHAAMGAALVVGFYVASRVLPA